MKTIGLIGGISWESSSHYYQLLNRTVRERLGGMHSAKCVLASVDFAEIAELQHRDRWDDVGAILNRAARGLERAGAELMLICANTIHKVAQRVMDGVTVPLVHIADATAERVKAAGVHKVALLGTRWTMEQDFYRGHLERQHGLTVMVPGLAEREEVNRVIYEELVQGRIVDASRSRYVAIIDELAQAGAEGVIAGCTEIGLLVGQHDVRVPFFDTTEIHARAAVDRALA